MTPTVTPCRSCSSHVHAGECTSPSAANELRSLHHALGGSRVLPTLTRAALIAAGGAVATVDCQPTGVPPYGRPPVFETGHADDGDSGDGY